MRVGVPLVTRLRRLAFVQLQVALRGVVPRRLRPLYGHVPQVELLDDVQLGRLPFPVDPPQYLLPPLHLVAALLVRGLHVLQGLLVATAAVLVWVGVRLLLLPLLAHLAKVFPVHLPARPFLVVVVVPVFRLVRQVVPFRREKVALLYEPLYVEKVVPPSRLVRRVRPPPPEQLLQLLVDWRVVLVALQQLRRRGV